jgi:hypothetical protein
MNDSQALEFVSDLMSQQATFFGHVRTLPQAIATAPMEIVLRDFSWSSTDARAALHIARACHALGYPERARIAVEWGLESSDEAATILRAELHSL